MDFYIQNISNTIGYNLENFIKGNEGEVDLSILSDFNKYIKEIVESVSIRTLITKLHEYKEKGFLRGNNPVEEYEYFNVEIVSTEAFFQEIISDFPILSDLLSKRVNNAVNYYIEVIHSFVEDKVDLEEMLGHEVKKITKISSSGADVHNHGKQVLRVELDSKIELLYKPRTMECECMHEELLQWFEKKTGIRQQYYKFLSYSDHSWCTIVEQKECETRDQLKAYYKRMGVQLFLAYVLGTKDLHCENVIAFGEYPVLIDLETLVNIRVNKERKTANDEIRYELYQTVLFTGLLPSFSWNMSGEGIDLSGICGCEGQKSPFKVPCVFEQGTSNMRIGYYYPLTKSTLNRATLNGEFIQPVVYKEHIKYGFHDAYNSVLKYKEEFLNHLTLLKTIKNRYVLLDTQRYAMMVSTSYHPSLLINEQSRNKFFDYQWQGRKENHRSVIESEIESLKNGDIPYFYYYMNSTSLYTGDGKEIEDYFKQVPYEIVLQKVDKLSGEDLEKQLCLIDVSLELSCDERKEYINHTYKNDERELIQINNQEFIKPFIEQLKEKIISSSVWNSENKEVNWYLTRISSGNGYRWNVQSADMYLYDGLSGMLLLMYGLLSYEKDARIRRIYDVLRNQLFSYTDTLCGQSLNERNTGAYTGESSVVYTYICMYRMTKDAEYLEYAKKHADLLEQLLEQDTKYDLLSGNAGAIVVLCLLYSITNNKRYLNMAVKAADMMQQHAIQYTSGIGWIVEPNMPAMSGMAHGNSGILMAFMTLWKYTGDKRYVIICREILEYEDSLYNFKIRNWMDIRTDKQNFEEENGSIAWCHGAGGILLSRMKCLEMAEDIFLKNLLFKDIKRASDKLKQYWKRDSWCLCHGICGNLWALGKYQNQKYWYHDTIKYLPQEIINPGLMNGYGGVLYYLLSLVNSELPNILSLE